MDLETRKFGRGPRELTGGADLISHYRLQPHHHFFCKKSLPISVTDTHYLHNVVGDVEIRKGDGMELDQLLENASYSRKTNACIQPFDIDALSQAFQLRESATVELPSVEKGKPTISSKLKDESKDKEKKHKKHKDRDGKDSEHRKHKHRHKDRDKDKDKDKKDKNGHYDLGSGHSRKHQDKKRKHEGTEDADIYKHKKSKHKDPKVGEVNLIKVSS